MAKLNNEIALMGGVLRKFRMERNLSQEKLAERCAMHRTYIGSIERGERNPSYRSLCKILETLEISWSRFGSAIDSIRLKNS